MEKRDLLIRFDEDEEKLLFFSVEQGSRGGPLKLAHQRPHLELSLRQLREFGPDEAERRVGAGALVFLDFHGAARTGVRDYEAIGTQHAAEQSNDLEKAALRGDAAAQFEMAMEHLDRSIRSRSREDLEIARKWLDTAIAGGSTDAKEFLGTEWERSKALAERRIADRDSEGH